jgi:metal-responsive CopG/Arc/MetJ family transcriptional regulator
VAKKNGRPLLEDRKQETRSVSVPKELWDEVEDLAAAENVSVSSKVRGALRWLVGQGKAEAE